MADITPAENYEPIIKKTVYGNVLDKFDSYQYNAKLYMIPPVTGNPQSSVQSSQDSTDARAETGSSAASASNTGGGYLNGAMIADPSETVILAQTGVTGTQIDNIEIETIPGPGNTISPTKVSFEITQAGSADFLDQIIAAKAYLGDKVLANNAPMFLEIIFKGYTDDLDDVNKGGIPTDGPGPYRFRLTLSAVTLEITDEGSTYSFACVTDTATACSDDAFRVPKEMDSVGSTIEEHVEDLVKKINEYSNENYNDYSIQDEIAIDLSGLTEGRYALTDLSITTPDEQKAEEINRIMNPEIEGKDEAEQRAILVEAPKDTGTSDIVPNQAKITVREKIKLDRYIATLLSMNDEFYNKATRSVKPNEAGDLEVDKSRPFIYWFRINASIQYLGYDKKRKKYAIRTIYKPVIYATAKSTAQKNVDESANLTPEETESRVNAMPVKKSYNYFYTGVNDQIRNCKIVYNPAIAILSAPSGGAAGDTSTTLAATLSSEASATEDLTGETIATQAVKIRNEESLGNLVRDLLSNPERENDVKNFATQILGFNASEAADLLQNKTGLNASLFKNALADKNIVRAALNAEKQLAKSNTTSDTTKNLDGTDYTPTLSGYVYAPDILGSVSERLDAAAAEDYAVRATQDKRKELEAEESSEVGAEQSIVTDHIQSQVADATYDGTVRNTIFGYLLEQHAASDFLVTLDMEIKGDPWYLGRPDLTGSVSANEKGSAATDEINASDEKSANLAGDDNYILFNLQTPRRFDFNVENEDENTGYWSPQGTSYFITGLYTIKSVIHTFSDGVFVQNVNLIKESSLQLSKIKNEAESTTDEDDS